MAQIFISGLPYTSTQEEVQELFQDCGEISSIKLPKYQDTQRLLGYGHITFTNPESAQAALKKNGIKLGGRYLEIKEAQGKQKTNTEQPPAYCLTIFVKNLPYDLNADQIGDAFRPCGKVKNVRMVFNHQSNHFKGFAFIDFETNQAVIKALQMNGKQVHGREIRVDFDTGKPKAGFKFAKDQLENQKKYNSEIVALKKRKIKKEKQKDKVHKIKNFAEEQRKISAKRNKEML